MSCQPAVTFFGEETALPCIQNRMLQSKTRFFAFWTAIFLFFCSPEGRFSHFGLQRLLSGKERIDCLRDSIDIKLAFAPGKGGDQVLSEYDPVRLVKIDLV